MTKIQETTALQVRDVSDAELPDMLALTLAAYDEFRADCPPDFWEKYTTNIAEAVLRGTDIERIAVFRGDEMVGCVLLCRRGMGTDDPEIRLLAVSPAARQQGIARLLMDECERRVAGRGHPRVMLHTTHLMKTARAMYERSGYVRHEETDFRPVPSFLVMGFVKSLV